MEVDRHDRGPRRTNCIAARAIVRMERMTMNEARIL